MIMRATVKDRWKSPRDTIAQVYKDNDYGYVMHAGMLFLEFLKASNLKPSEIRPLKILDYGCGTGRVTRFVALTGANATGYDPTPECILESAIEGEKAPPTTLVPVKFTSNFNDIEKDYDIVYCINVLDHLTRQEHDTAILNITNSLKEGGICYLWVNKNTFLPLKDLVTVRSQKTNVLVIKGVKINGKIAVYEKA